MPKKLLLCSVAALAVAACGSSGSQMANAVPSAQPVALQITTTAAHTAAARKHKRVVHAKPAAAVSHAAQTQTQTQTVSATPPPATSSSPPPSVASSSPAPTTSKHVPVHKHKKSSGTSAGGTPVSSQGY